MERFAPLNLTREELIEFTPEWKGERFDDGRPRVPDDIVERMRNVSLTQAWGVLRCAKYHWQFEGNWMCSQPGKTLVGRAMTAVYMPRREELRALIFNKAQAAGCIGDQVSWPIDTLVQGDVYVADVMGEIDRRWEQHIEDDFSQWLQDHMDELPVPKETIQNFLSKRTW